MRSERIIQAKIAVLEKVRQSPSIAFTAWKIGFAVGIGEPTARTLLNELVAEGLIASERVARAEGLGGLRQSQTKSAVHYKAITSHQ